MFDGSVASEWERKSVCLDTKVSKRETGVSRV
jgi:hypothetical protein